MYVVIYHVCDYQYLHYKINIAAKNYVFRMPTYY